MTALLGLGLRPAAAQLAAAPGSVFTRPDDTPVAMTPPDLNAFSGSGRVDKLVAGVIRLSLRDALERGLNHNLGLLLSQQQTVVARAQHWRNLSALLPNVSARVSESVQKVNLAAFGIPFTVNGSSLVGPFGVFDARPVVTERILDFSALGRLQSADESEKAARHSLQDARELVVLIVGNEYLLTLTNAARLESARAELQTAKVIFERSQDLKTAGVAAGIDVLRSQVQMQQQQQRVLVAENQLQKQRMQLARVIGLPVSQPFELTDSVPNSPMPPVELEPALQRAYDRRPDYLAFLSRVRAAGLQLKAARGEALPTLDINGDIGAIGRTVASARETYSIAASLRIPIFQGGKVKGDVMQAQAVLDQLRDQLEDMKGRIEFEVRSSLLDVQTANDQVAVAQQSIELAGEQLRQAQDRYASGVSGSLEVVQAQEAVATANETYIQALYRINVAKLLLARALGVAEQQVRDFLGGR
ncbi:MAG TPA: TolC family protein [Candidatus Saccharimonadales bacterium]|nr:TolC family protein [Candidatus Saccharimonadales bacterium]